MAHLQMTEEETKHARQRVVRLEKMLVSIYEGLPYLVQASLPKTTANTIEEIRNDISKTGETGEL